MTEEKRKVNAVGAIIIGRENGGEVLCALRSESQGHAGKWEFAGGTIEEDEAPWDAVVREVKEELGCDVQVWGRCCSVVHEYENSIVNLITYFCTLIGDQQPQALEHDEIRWVGFTDVGELDWAEADLPSVEFVKTMKIE